MCQMSVVDEPEELPDEIDEDDESDEAQEARMLRWIAQVRGMGDFEERWF